MSTIKDLRNIRLDKLSKLKTLGINPYVSNSNRDTYIGDIRKNFDIKQNQEVTVAGRIISIRNHGKLTFMDIEDQTDKIQLYIKKDKLIPANYANSEVDYENLNLLDAGDFIESQGIVTKTRRGEISVESQKIRLLTKSLRPLPTSWDGLRDIETRYRQRYADMAINKNVRDVFIKRTLIVDTIRNFLNNKGFIEIETPTLQPIYGGASARPFKTYHNALGHEFYLRISNELYLKKAIVGGFEKVYEFARDFRNEGIDKTHNPEFTMLEFYWAYANYEDLMKLVQDLMTEILIKIHGSTRFKFKGIELDFTPPYPRKTFKEVILENTGIDIDKATYQDIVDLIKQKKLDIDISNNPPLKDILDEFYKHTCRKKIIQPIYLIDYPYEMIPLAKRKEDDPTKIATFQLVCAGIEIVKAYNELNDPIDQKERMLQEQEFLDQQKSQEAHPIDYDFIRALEYGMPPTAGCGIGIDRLTLLVLDQENIKDVIMFPTTGPEDYSDEIDLIS